MKVHSRVLDPRVGQAHSSLTLLILLIYVLVPPKIMAQPSSEPTRVNPSVTLPKIGERLTDQQVSAFAKLALSGMDTEFPNKPSNVMASSADVRTPREMHPAFYGCFDWHSSVHGHWMLARLLRLYPDCTVGPEIRAALNKHLSPENMEAEAEYFRQPYNKSFERMYGWAWYFRLVAELDSWPDNEAQQWRRALVPLEELLVQRVKDYLPKLQFPIRTGVHPNTAFALGQILDYAVQTDQTELAELIRQRSKEYFWEDRDYPTRYEPSGEDFFSPAWNEVDLMRRVLDTDTFAKWLTQFLPGLSDNESGLLLIPVEVSDVTDGKIVHLAGLDLNRAWCLRGISSDLVSQDSRLNRLRASADEHLEKGLEYVFSGHYEGEHWLATFAVYALTEVAVQNQE
jgi:hypothetical protein